ncbi:ATP-binding protein [Streptomyces sp. NPDC047028]|uniref:ATP-binding protein n=1 Tax=Streptomyces sp. NPDC047028 TaxID=3155793 RepID=UPI0033E2DB0B
MTVPELRLLATPKAVPELRHHLREHGFDVRLCATELLANVIRHVGEGTPVTVRVIGAPGRGRTRVEVTDPDPWALPVLLCAGATAESGRGMALLDALAVRGASNWAVTARRCGARWPTEAGTAQCRTASWGAGR